jgi:hypothetical protein
LWKRFWDFEDALSNDAFEPIDLGVLGECRDSDAEDLVEELVDGTGLFSAGRCRAICA